LTGFVESGERSKGSDVRQADKNALPHGAVHKSRTHGRQGPHDGFPVWSQASKNGSLAVDLPAIWICTFNALAS
jgi:hypothetical protein